MKNAFVRQVYYLMFEQTLYGPYDSIQDIDKRYQELDTDGREKKNVVIVTHLNIPFLKDSSLN